MGKESIPATICCGMMTSGRSATTMARTAATASAKPMGTAASTRTQKMPRRRAPISRCPSEPRMVGIVVSRSCSGIPPQPPRQHVDDHQRTGHRRRGIDESDRQVQGRGALSHGEVHQRDARGDEEEREHQHDRRGEGLHGPLRARGQALGDLVEPEVSPMLHRQRCPEQRHPDEAEARDLLAPGIRVGEEVAHQDLEKDHDGNRDHKAAHGVGLEPYQDPIDRPKPSHHSRSTSARVIR